VSALGLGWHSSVLWTSFCLFGLGLGWNVSYVARQRTSPTSRHRPSAAG
jgi:hypothetical protein